MRARPLLSAHGVLAAEACPVVAVRVHAAVQPIALAADVRLAARLRQHLLTQRAAEGRTRGAAG